MMTDFTCPECNGTGVYQGLNTVEPCRACGGLQGGILVPPDIANAICDAARENRAIYGKPITSHEIRERFAEAEILYGNPDAETPGGKIGKSVIEHAAERAGIKLTDGPVAFDAIWSVFTATYLPEPSKPFDEIMPAELEGIKEGDSIKVEIHCEDWTRVFHIFDRIIDRPLFGLPSNSFRFVSFASTPNGEGQKPIVHGTLLYKPLSDADTFTLKNSAGETVWEQRLYTCDPCQDMLFIPILED